MDGDRIHSSGSAESVHVAVGPTAGSLPVSQLQAPGGYVAVPRFRAVGPADRDRLGRIRLPEAENELGGVHAQEGNVRPVPAHLPPLVDLEFDPGSEARYKRPCASSRT